MGKSIALLVAGINLGSVLGLGVLLNVFTYFKFSYKMMFSVTGGLMMLMGVATLFMVKDPSQLAKYQPKSEQAEAES